MRLSWVQYKVIYKENMVIMLHKTHFKRVVFGTFLYVFFVFFPVGIWYYSQYPTSWAEDERTSSPFELDLHFQKLFITFWLPDGIPVFSTTNAIWILTPTSTWTLHSNSLLTEALVGNAQIFQPQRRIYLLSQNDKIIHGYVISCSGNLYRLQLKITAPAWSVR